MRPSIIRALFLLPFTGLFLSRAPGGDEPAKPPEAPPPARPETAKVVQEALRIEVSLSGVLEAQRKTEVVLDPEVWTAFTVVKACEPGERVKKGDPLVVFETDQIDEEIRDLKAAQETSALALDQASDELRWLQESNPLDLAAAVRAKQVAEDDLKRFLEVDGPLAEKLARNLLQQTQFSLEYASEELRQLEKMYKADDLTEETEEIILTRARRDVENARIQLEAARIRTEETLKINLPRQKEGHLEAAKRQAIAFSKAVTGIPKTEARKKLEFLKMKADHEKARQKLEKLQKDRALMTLPSPQDGIVFYGRFQRGKWVDPGTLAEELRPGGKVAVTGRKVLLTVLEPRPLSIRADVPEKDLWLVRPQVEGRASPPSLAGAKLKVRVEKVSPVPIGPGVFEARLQVELGDEAKALLPGMDCPVKLLGYSNPEARTIPASALFTEEPFGDRPHVYLLKPDGSAEKRRVVPGKRTESKVEILEGLSVGNEVLLKKPEKEAKLY